MKKQATSPSRGWSIWVKYQSRFTHMQLREKYAILFVGLFSIVYLGFWFVVMPQQVQAQDQQQQLHSVKQELKQTTVQLAMLEQALNTDYTKTLREQIANAQQELVMTNAQLSTFSQGFVAAEQVPTMLKALLKNHPEVEVLSFKVLPAKSIDVSKLGEKEAQTFFFEHQMTLTLQGEYFGLQNYLESLRNNQEQLLIQEFNYQVQAYPHARLTIQLATVSANEKFLTL